MAIRIITDSTSDISLDLQKKLGIEIVSLNVRFGDEEYLDGVNLSKEDFYKKLAQCEQLPTTAQVNPDKFVEVFSKYTDTADEVIGIFISSKLSGTFQSAQIAKKILNNENIYLVDSLSGTFGLALLVYEAIRMRDGGQSAKEIHSAVEKLTGRLRLYAIVDTLKYLKMGGRLSSSSAFLGTILHIKPILSVENGVIVPVDKKKGQKAAVECIAQKMSEEKPDTRYQVVFGDSDAPDLTEMMKSAVSATLAIENSESVAIGTVVGTHTGPGCAGVAYIASMEELDEL